MLKVDKEDSSCWFWSGEQQRITNLVEAYIKEQEHSSVFFMKFNFRGDICLPPSAEPNISFDSRTYTREPHYKNQKRPLHILVINFNKRLWEEMRSGCYLFCVQIMDMIALRLDYKRTIGADVAKIELDSSAHVYEFIENTK